MKIAVNSILSLLDVGTGFCYWLLGRDLLEEEVKRIEKLFIRVQKPDDQSILIDELRSLSPGKDLLLVCDQYNHNLIQWCVLNNYVQALIVLLEYGCNPTRTGQPDQDLPLAIACCLGEIEIIQLLLDYGANPSQTTMLSNEILEYLAEKTSKEHYLKLIDLLKYKSTISSLNIVFTFDDLSIFRLLMGETIEISSISSVSLSTNVLTSSTMNVPNVMNDHQTKLSQIECDIFSENSKLDRDVDEIIVHHHPSNPTDDCLDKQQQQQNIIGHDDLSDYAEQGPFFSFCDTLDVESAVVNHDDGAQTLSDKGNHVDRMPEEETCALGATTDGGYCTVDGSSERIKAQSHLPPADAQHLSDIHPEKTKVNRCPIDIETNNSHVQRLELISRSKSQHQLSKSCLNVHRNSLPSNVFETTLDQPSKRYRSTSSFLLTNMSNSTKHTAHLLRLLHQMIEYEAAAILEYFLNRHRDEFNSHFHSAARSSDIQLKTYELLANIKSDRIYNVLSSSNCAYFNTVTTSLCDRENNTLVHSLLSQNPLKYQPEEMIKMLERYMTCGLNEFINRPNLSNDCMIQILLCNEYFLQMIFFRRTSSSSSSFYKNANQDASLPFYDRNLIQKWRRSYLILIEILIKYGARIDMPAGSYRNSIDGLLSSLIDLNRRLASTNTLFDVEYLKHLLGTLMSSFDSMNSTKTRSIYFKYNIERFIQLICGIHIHNDHLFDILFILDILLRYECQPLKLNTNSILHLFKLWISNPNFLCSNLTQKDSFMRNFLISIVQRLNISTQQSNSISDTPLILTTTNNLPRKSSLTSNDNELTLQNFFFLLLNLISFSQTCVQIQTIYHLILVLINHSSIDIINHDFLQLPIVYLCLQVKVTHAKLIYPFIDLFSMTHSSTMIRRTKDILSQTSIKRSSTDLYKYFLSIEKSKTPVRSLRHVSSKYLYHHLQKPFFDSVKRLPIGDALKERLIHFHDV